MAGRRVNGPGPAPGGLVLMQNEATSADRRLVRTSVPGIYRRGSRYVVVYRDPAGRQRKRSARTLAEARDVKAALRADVARGEYRALSRVTFAEYAAEWVEHYAGRTARGLREETRRDYRRAIERRAVPFFGRMRLAEIEPRDVKRYMATVRAEGLAANTVRLALAPVKALLATAVEEGLIRSNPSVGLRVAGQATGADEEPEAERVRALTEDELRRLLARVAPDSRLLVEFLTHTGLRISEAVALRWGDLDFGRRRVQVRRRFYRGSFGPPKSRYGRRDVPLTPGMARRLWQLRKAVRASDEQPVFIGRNGGPLDASTAFRVVKSAARRAGVQWAGLHTLRHTCATMLFRQGLNAVQVQLWLGHHSPAFTIATYVHLLPEDLPSPDFLDELTPSGPRWPRQPRTDLAADAGG